MDRRSFVRGAGLLAAAGLGHAEGSPRPGPAVQDDDRSSTREPTSVERSTLVVNGLDPSVLNERYLDMLKTGGVNCWHKSMDDVQSFADLYTFTDVHSDRIVPATTVKEIRQAYQQGKIALIMGWQSANVLGHMPGEPPPTALRAFYQMGLRICSIAYNVANIFGAGCIEPQIGLTRAGHRLVEEIHTLRMVLDVGGHTGEQTSLDALAISSGVPVICSHTNPLALIDNPRATSDRVLEAIAKTGGVIGVTAFNDFHVRTRRDTDKRQMPQANLDKHLDHYDYLKKLVGADHVGLGPDFVEGSGGGGGLNALRSGSGSRGGGLNRATMPIEAYSDQPWLYIKGFENISELPNVTRGLIERGWSTAEIHKLLGENWLRVYEKVWGA